MNLRDKYIDIAREFTGKVLQKYPNKVDVIILFGSTARGEAREESDIDILVVGDVTVRNW
ncbi:MAG: nucleotidyltransferase domain-containing protein [Euryarchaeota archaeon]|nr:nucleotidyltransferase domain-containing protein [Euryarchaeota archaeon]MBV1756148.1 nucleotidyltransferase domain-containing protein [Methanobacterium sp.]MBV1768157.1 nucleotidyltransferase domain-containing protein [Methanobacterium sp.]